MRTIKYLLDEHIDPRLRKALKKLAPELTVWGIGDPGTPTLGTPDPQILIWCEAHGFSLVTNNRASMPVHLQACLAEGRHVPGIFIINTRMSLGETAEELILIWEASAPEEYQDHLRYLPQSC